MLTSETYLAILKALAALDATAKQLPNPTLLRLPTLRWEEQSTSALEGTYAPPGLSLNSGVRDLTDWMRDDHSESVDPVVAAAMSHYQFETLHPFMDGNGRVGRCLIVLHLHATGVLSEPRLTVSPWFEARRAEYHDRLFGVSARGDWDGYIQFFAKGLASAAEQTKNQMIALVAVQAELKDRLRASTLRADSAHALVDLAVANPSFTVGKVESELGLSYGRVNKLVGQLVDLNILSALDPGAYKRRFYSPRVMAVLIG